MSTGFLLWCFVGMNMTMASEVALFSTNDAICAATLRDEFGPVPPPTMDYGDSRALDDDLQ